MADADDPAVSEPSPEEPPRPRREPVTRRRFLHGSGAVLALAALEGGMPPPAGADVTDPFPLGVASGDPQATSVVLWTRLDPALMLDPRPPTPVRWVVATDERLRNVVRTGTAFASAENGLSVHVTVLGLQPDRWYWYRFEALGAVSRLGRTRTFPLFWQSPTRLRFGLASCQDFQNGFYSAYHHLAREDLDFVLFVGDYIYEGGRRSQGPRLLPDGEGETRTLDDYRRRYAIYRSDASLQDAHAAFPFVVAGDDHEVDNDFAGLHAEDGASLGEFAARRAAAYQAYYENMPLRSFTRPIGPFARTFRRFAFGRLASLHVLDTRQFRTDQPCQGFLQIVGNEFCPAEEVFDPGATMTGALQEDWLQRGLADSASTWNLIGQQVMMMRWNLGGLLPPDPETNERPLVFNLDAWDGYPEARDRLLRFIDAARVPNVVVLTGDIHSAWTADLRADFQDPSSSIVGSEFVTTSISSSFPAIAIPFVNASLADNPHVRFFDGLFHGYMRFDVTRERFLAEHRIVTSIRQPDVSRVPAFTIARFAVESGNPGVQTA